MVSPEQAQDLIQRDSRNQDVLFPYLNGEDLNSRPDCSASRWVINFHDWPEERAREYPEVFAIVDHHVKPERLKNNRKLRRERWWQFAERAPRLYSTISGLDRVLVVARVSKTAMPVFVPTGQVASEQTVTFATDSSAELALLSSSIHHAWAVSRASSLKGDLRYTPSDVYETMPQPDENAEMLEAGKVLEMSQRAIMTERGIGLTGLYNLLHSSAGNDDCDIRALREAQSAVDSSVLNGYGWRDLHFEYDLIETRQGIRFTIPQGMKIELCDRLLELNHALFAGGVTRNSEASHTCGPSPADVNRSEGTLF
ncbi:type IIL restriction-modification enzyme MmeI [Streptomyces cyaneofuscatus]|uniref:type IIL restriction-modification enzyme MmeI n=1 Tax=Streptomyces cyaneofuscatus TaxID=66883 RepID=UPI002DDC0A46|nr:type IIL restriction-modification enzyme MmeI [Streptomyces cyaneofuscatus]